MGEEPNVHRRMPLAQLPDDEADERYDDRDQQAEEGPRPAEPIEVIALIEDGLQPEENNGQQKNPRRRSARCGA